MDTMSNKKKSQWTLPNNYKDYFSASSDEMFKARHPFGYPFLVALGMIALLLPMVLYLVFVFPVADNNPWLLLGVAGAFIVGVGFFNFVSIIIKQYLGHLVSILSFLVGAVMIWISLLLVL